MDDQIRHFDELLTALTDTGIALKIKTFHFYQRQSEYLDLMDKRGCLKIDNTNVASLRDAAPPTNKTQLRYFLGLCKVYSRFIDGFTGLAHPLNNVLKK